MKLDLDKHPCFKPGACKTYGRVHLPVAPKCNMQCRYCNRSYDCVNESRPGVTSSILSPYQSLYYLENLTLKEKISVVGIAGPGDPFANPDETLETMELVRGKFPGMLLCTATNGLNLNPFIDDLAFLGVSHVTLTINSVDPVNGGDFYKWMRYKKRGYRGLEAAEILWEEQKKAIPALKKKGIIVKVNTVVVPGMNDDKLGEIAEAVKDLGADIMNAMPLIPVKGSDFEDKQEMKPVEVFALRHKIKDILPQMSHCQRCRADAAGLLGANNADKIAEMIKDAASRPKFPQCTGDRVAVASREGVMVNQHLGECRDIMIFRKAEKSYVFEEKRAMPDPGTGVLRWKSMVNLLGDCSHVLVSGIGDRPLGILNQGGIEVALVEGIIDLALTTLFNDGNLNYLAKRERKACSGAGMFGGCA